MKLLHLATIIAALPACLAVSSSFKKSSRQQQATDSSPMLDMSAYIDKVLPRLMGAMDIEGQLARKICEHDNPDEPLKCVQLIADPNNEYRLQVRTTMSKTGLRQAKLTTRDEDIDDSEGENAKNGKWPEDPVKLCMKACVALLKVQCNGKTLQHGHLDCRKSALKQKCRDNCKASRDILSNAV